MPPAPRRPAAGAAVLRGDLTGALTGAVLDELAEVGYARLSMGSVARRAGAGKSALYRRWPSKLEMVTAALAELSVPLSRTPDTGSLHGDLVLLLDAVVAWLTEDRIARILPDLIAEASRDPAMARAIAATTGEPRRTLASAVLQRARDRGELPAPTDLDLALDLLAGLVYWRLFARHAVVGPDYVQRLAAFAERALGARPVGGAADG